MNDRSVLKMYTQALMREVDKSKAELRLNIKQNDREFTYFSTVNFHMSGKFYPDVR